MVRALALLMTVIAVVLVAGQLGARDASAGPTGGRGTFLAECMLSHRANDDPIVFRRGPGLSHSHDFIGGRTSAFSTGRSLRKSRRTTCVRTNATGKRRTADKSGYWVPTLYDHGRPVFPASPGVGVYYFTGIRDHRAIRPFPAGLRVIAGSANGQRTTTSSVARPYTWTCGGARLAPALGPGQAPLCVESLNLEIRFPDCWDGIHRDSPDHRSHMAYSDQERPSSNRRVCPSTHPVLVPELVLQIRYPTKGGPGVQLASGDLRTAHADFMNGWNQKELRRLVRECITADLYCGGNDGPVPGHA